MNSLTFVPTSISGTSLRGYLYEGGDRQVFSLLVAKLLTLASMEDMNWREALTSGDKVSVEFAGRFNGQVFTLYDYKGDFALHIGGFSGLDVEELVRYLGKILDTTEPTPFTHTTDYDQTVAYGWPEPEAERPTRDEVISIVERNALTEDDYNFITNALRVAAEVYEGDAKKMHTYGRHGLEEQFTNQAQKARLLADAIE